MQPKSFSECLHQTWRNNKLDLSDYGMVAAGRETGLSISESPEIFTNITWSFSNLQWSRFCDPVPIVASDSGSSLTGMSPNVVLCGEPWCASRLSILCILRCFSVLHRCTEITLLSHSDLFHQQGVFTHRMAAYSRFYIIMGKLMRLLCVKIPGDQQDLKYSNQLIRHQQKCQKSCQLSHIFHIFWCWMWMLIECFYALFFCRMNSWLDKYMQEHWIMRLLIKWIVSA